MIDLHCHLLDGAGCGSNTFEESLAMCRLAAAGGVRTIVATPRWEVNSNEPPLPISECQQKLDKLREEMGDTLSIRLGFLLKFRSGLDALMEQYGASITLGGGRCALVALPALRVPEDAEAVWKKLGERGFSVLLAHPECSPALRRDAQLLAGWVKQGLLLQLDAASIVGSHGREAQRFAWRCIQEFPDSVVIASSAQSANPNAATLGQAREQLIKKNGIRRVDRLVNAVPAAIISNNHQRSTNDKPGPSRLRSFSLMRTLKLQKSFTNAS